MMMNFPFNAKSSSSETYRIHHSPLENFEDRPKYTPMHKFTILDCLRIIYVGFGVFETEIPFP